MVFMQSQTTPLVPRLALVSLIASASPGAAWGADLVSESVLVSSHGLDLRTPAGAKRFRHRVVVASHKMCANEPGLGGIGTDAFDGCVSESVHDAAAPMEAMIAAAQGAKPSILASRAP